MARKASLSGLTKHIESLLKQRADHHTAITEIDAALDQIKSALGGKIAAAPGVKVVKRAYKRRKKRGSFTMSGDDSILTFIKSAGTPTTKEVNQHWKGEGRGGSADNALTKLVKMKKLKRMNLKGQRGSKYAMA